MVLINLLEQLMDGIQEISSTHEMTGLLQKILKDTNRAPHEEIHRVKSVINYVFNFSCI